MGRRVSKSAPEEVDAYLAAAPEASRAALERLRKTIKAAAPKAAAPKATEGIGYAIPAFYHHGPLVSFSAATKHCSFHVMSPAVMQAFQKELEPYDTATATIRFSPEKPLPAALVRKLVKARIEENEAQAGA
jgi:uncharacterized protein YdhG (YjbR/CyaY superfamily)